MPVAPMRHVQYTVEAATARDSLTDHQRTAFDKGIALLARDPFPDASRPFGSPARTERST
ncbi:hypothetical protein ACIRVK_30525 [Streptomyces sp. NPDC101152]|uniref:hypothetical protein n=1 Tax=Streptomyces sp. NPDC101152 TaxID=3366116 RepID=UPI0038037696